LKRGACPGWEVDHVIPLACGGCDAVANMQWLPSGAKSTSSPLAKDRWERRVYCDAARAN
jgi:5-methylcytosine-specific restriction endonuclease McrA